jgi:catechol 2,3-dioxygenase-like lactoylglutathione lyase family enzyme
VARQKELVRLAVGRTPRPRRTPCSGFFVLAVIFASWGNAQTDALPPPGFHHLHLNSTDPEAAIDFYTKQFPSTSKSTWGGMPALKTGKVYVLFNKVSTPAPNEPQTAIWHFGWHVVDVRETNARYNRDHVPLLPLYTGDGDNAVYISSDTWPGAGGTLGRSKAQIAEAKANGVKPAGGAGFAYLLAPDGAAVEYQGNMPAERFNHVHMYQDEPFCAQLWYQKHLNAAMPGRGRGPQHTEADCKVERTPDKSWPALDKDGMYRIPGAGVLFDDVSLNWYIRQGDSPLVSTRGHMADHFALSVSNLDAWVNKLGKEGVRFLPQQQQMSDGRIRVEGLGRPYKLGETRAIMIEGPSKEAIELVEVK